MPVLYYGDYRCKRDVVVLHCARRTLHHLSDGFHFLYLSNANSLQLDCWLFCDHDQKGIAKMPTKKLLLIGILLTTVAGLSLLIYCIVQAQLTSPLDFSAPIIPIPPYENPSNWQRLLWTLTIALTCLAIALTCLVIAKTVELIGTAILWYKNVRPKP